MPSPISAIELLADRPDLAAGWAELHWREWGGRAFLSRSSPSALMAACSAASASMSSIWRSGATARHGSSAQLSGRIGAARASGRR